MKSFEDYARICSVMIYEMDLTRERWLSLLKEVLTGADLHVVSTEFKSDIDIGVLKEIIPEFYPFKYISGRMVEAALIGWQIAVAMHFIEEQSYVPHDRLREFCDQIARVSGKDELWVAGGMGFSLTDTRRLGGGLNPNTIIIIANDIAEAIAYFVTAETNIDKVSAVVSKINMASLAGLTQLGVATAFGDAKTAGDIMEKISGDSSEPIKIHKGGIVEMPEELPEILKEIELGPVNRKLSAIGKLRSIGGQRLDLVQPVLDKILAGSPDGSLLRFCAAANLAALGDSRDIIVDILIPYLGREPFDEGDHVYDFPWLANYGDQFPEGVGAVGVILGFSTQLATLEALSHIRANDRPANKIIEVLGLLKKADWRTFAIYALGSNGNPVARPTLEYYRDKLTGSLEGRAAHVALEHFGKATLIELARLHRDQTPQTAKSGCYIATMVYGKANTPEVQIFRRFRDEVLLSHLLGRRLVSLYYFLSPRVVSSIGRFRFCRSVIKRIMLEPLIQLVNYREMRARRRKPNGC